MNSLCLINRGFIAVVFFVIAVSALFAVPSPVAAQVIPGAKTESTMPAEQARVLADVLKDDTARAALIKELERISAPADGSAKPAPEPHEPSVGRKIAETTASISTHIAEGAGKIWTQLISAPERLAALESTKASILTDALLDLALIIVVTVGVFLVLRRFAKRLYRRIGAQADGAGFLRSAMLALGSVVIDAGVVLLAWGLGYLVAVAFIGEYSAISTRQALYLNAFLIVEMIKVAMRTILSPAASELRPAPLPDRAARLLTKWVGAAVSVLGYGQLLIVPIINENVSFMAGQAAAVLVYLTALLILITLTLSNRAAVADWLVGGQGLTDRPGALRFLAHNWHVPVLVYLAVLFIIVITRPGGLLFPILAGSARVLAAVIIGAIVGAGLRRLMARGVRLPEQVTQRLPLLEPRLNAFVPKLLLLVRFAIIVAVVLFVVNTIDLIDVHGWLISQVGVNLTGILFSLFFILLLGFAVWLAISSWIDFRLNPDYGSTPTARERTLLSLFRNAMTIALIVITIMFAFSEIGIDIAPLIASAGVFGLAIGFGAQKLVQDIITGIFIQFENAMNVGDVVNVCGTTGTVERLTIRSVSLRDLHGAFHIIPFSSVDMVTNFMREFGQYVCDMGIAYKENVDDAKVAMTDAFEELRADEQWGQLILEDMTWFGVTTFGDSAVTVRSRIKCAPGKQWGVGRAYNAILKRVFDERGIEIPFPHRTIYFGETKEGAPTDEQKMLTEGKSSEKSDEAGT